VSAHTIIGKGQPCSHDWPLLMPATTAFDPALPRPRAKPRGKLKDSHTFACSTIGPAELNFHARDGDGRIPRGEIIIRRGDVVRLIALA
jgi:hypothetical protein